MNTTGCKTVAVVGLGLIGGSIAKAFQKYTPHRVLGLDRDTVVMREALDCGAIDEAITPAQLAQASLIYLCLYPQAAIDFIREYGCFIAPGCIVTDTCGIKTEICAQMPQLAASYGFTFIGAHPMAGRERNGFVMSDADLFLGASFILTPCGAAAEAVAELKRTTMPLGFSASVETTPEDHDRLIAFTSQVPHALACAYVMSPGCPRHKGFSAGSYRDVSRVANINAELWSELFLDNAAPLSAELETLIRHLSLIRQAVDSRDRDRLRELLRQGRLVKEELGE